LLHSAQLAQNPFHGRGDRSAQRIFDGKPEQARLPYPRRVRYLRQHWTDTQLEVRESVVH
jgi:hypothetical protein